MMNREIIAVKINVTKRGAQVFFQIILPRDTHHIERIETGVLGMGKAGGSITGTLRLQATGVVDSCYQEDVRIGNTGMESTLLGFENAGAYAAWAIQPFVAGQRKKPEMIYLNGNRELSGCYRDEIGLFNEMDVTYTVGLYLHSVIKKEKK